MNRIKIFAPSDHLSTLETKLKKIKVKYRRGDDFVRTSGDGTTDSILIAASINAIAIVLAKAIESVAKHRKRKVMIKITDGHRTVTLENYSTQDIQKLLPTATAVYLNEEQQSAKPPVAARPRKRLTSN